MIERSYVGLFNNAVIRSFPEDSVLQEYSVHVDGRKYIRGDYLVKHQSTNILFEAKQRPFDGKTYEPADTKIFLDAFIKQGMEYYNAEQHNYNGSTFVSSLVFEWVRYPKHLELVNTKSWNEDDDGITDFYCLYHTDIAGLMVYGNLEKVKE